MKCTMCEKRLPGQQFLCVNCHKDKVSGENKLAKLMRENPTDPINLFVKNERRIRQLEDRVEALEERLESPRIEVELEEMQSSEGEPL